MIRAFARSVMRWASRAYVAGATLEDAVRVSNRLAAQELATSIGYWNVAGEAPRAVADAYLAGLERIARARLDCSLSIKASAMGCSRALVDEVVARAVETGVGVHFDAMRPESAGPTLQLIAESAARFPRVGCTLPARWQRSARDAQRALELGVNVRVVKGQWADPLREVDPREGYLSLIDRLAGRARHVAVATHDPALAHAALARLRAAGTPCQQELLFGLPLKAALRVAVEAGVSTRIYVPYGEAWIPYCVSRLRENPRILVWLARDALLGRAGKIPRKRGQDPFPVRYASPGKGS
jgi:proline dehydrogenase